MISPVGVPLALAVIRTYIVVLEIAPELVERIKLPEKLESSVDTSNPVGAVTVIPELFDM